MIVFYIASLSLFYASFKKNIVWNNCEINDIFFVYSLLYLMCFEIISFQMKDTSLTVNYLSTIALRAI